MVAAKYDDIGVNYSELRKPDPRIGAVIEQALQGAKTVLNVGAGTGSYASASRRRRLPPRPSSPGGEQREGERQANQDEEQKAEAGEHRLQQLPAAEHANSSRDCADTMCAPLGRCSI